MLINYLMLMILLIIFSCSDEKKGQANKGNTSKSNTNAEASPSEPDEAADQKSPDGEADSKSKPDPDEGASPEDPEADKVPKFAINGLNPLFMLSSIGFNGKTCSTSECGNDLLAPADEVERLQDLGFKVYGLAGVENGGAIGCLFEDRDAASVEIRKLFATIGSGLGIPVPADTDEVAILISRGVNSMGTNHLIFTEWEEENNFNDIATNFTGFKKELGFIIKRQIMETDDGTLTALGSAVTEAGVHVVRLIRAYDEAQLNHTAYAAWSEADGYINEEKRMTDLGFTQYKKTLGWVISKDNCTP